MKERKKCVFGFIDDSDGWEEKMFIKVAKAKHIEIIPFNIEEKFSEKDIREKAKKCDIIYNDTGELIAIELVKTLEQMDKKVVEASETFYYSEDKWIFYLKCRENKIPIPETQLLSMSLTATKKDLMDFGQWPVVLKRVDSSGGLYVEKADNIKQAMKIIKKYWSRSKDRNPIIAQEFVKSYCYRVLLIDGKIVQTALKRGHGWKLTGVYANRFWKFKPDKELKAIVKKIAKFTNIKILGIDLLKKNKKWLVIEANAEPSFTFFDSEREKMIGKVIDFLKKEARPTCQNKSF